MADTKQGFSNQGYKPDTFNSGGVATAVKDKAKDLAAGAGEMAEQAKEKVQDWANTATGKVGETRQSVGESIESLGGRIRQKGPHSGMLGNATESVAETVEATGAYLREHDFADMSKEVTGVIRRYPIQSLLIGVGLGFLLARATRSQS